MPVEPRSPVAYTPTFMNEEPLEGNLHNGIAARSYLVQPELRTAKLIERRWKLNQKAKHEPNIGSMPKGNANADDDAHARKPCTGNLYARFEEGSGGNSSAPTLPLTIQSLTIISSV